MTKNNGKTPIMKEKNKKCKICKDTGVWQPNFPFIHEPCPYCRIVTSCNVFIDVIKPPKT